MNIKKLIKELNARKKAIGKERDRLRNIISEFEDLENVCEVAFQDIESAIETLSELA